MSAPGVGSRRGFLATAGAITAAALAGCAAPLRAGGRAMRAAPTARGGGLAAHAEGRAIVGGVSGATIAIPDLDAAPIPAIAPPGVIYNGQPTPHVTIDASRGHPDVRSFRRKFGLLVPATNTSMEHELWSVLVANRAVIGMDGIGLHTTGVVTPRPRLRTEADLAAYGRQFLGGLSAAVDQALLAQPHYLIMGMSLEHILHGIAPIRAVMAEAQARTGLAWATWHDAAPAALRRFGARRIGLLTPFDRAGNANATRMFEDLGFEVVASVGFSCADALHIAHIPDAAKEQAITGLLATRANRLDAVVQCGTNMSLLGVTERLESRVGIPILGINAVTLWYALRENGFASPVAGAGRLLREF